MKIVFGIIGSGWRSEFYMRAAKLMPDKFEICGVVTTNRERADKIRESFGLRIFKTADEMLKNTNPEFVVVSVAKAAAADVSLSLLNKSVPVLAETPAADSIEKLLSFNREIPGDSKYQVAEQYFLQPMHSAMLSFIKSGKIGEVHQARISFTNTYHAISLMRKFLGLGFENTAISAKRFKVPGLPGFSRKGNPASEEILMRDQTIAVFDFDGRTGVYDFEADQHRSWIRSQQILIKGTRGEINNTSIQYLKDYLTPVQSDFKRVNMGENENLEGYGLKGIIADSEWHYINPFLNNRLTDDEIAVASCIVKMSEYVKGGASFYSAADASQDMYFAELIEKAVSTGMTIKSETQPWAK